MLFCVSSHCQHGQRGAERTPYPFPLWATPLPACGCRQVKVNLSSCQVTRKYLSASLSRISTGKSVERSNRRAGEGEICLPQGASVCRCVRVCRCVCASVVQQAVCATQRRTRDEAKSQPMSKKQQTNRHTHRRTHAQDVSVSWTHKATHRAPPPLLCTAHVHQLVAMPRSLAASSTLWPFIRYVLYLCLPTLMVLMPFVLAHPAGTHSPPPPHDIHLCQPGTHTHTDCKGSKRDSGGA